MNSAAATTMFKKRPVRTTSAPAYSRVAASAPNFHPPMLLLLFNRTLIFVDLLGCASG
jgi:hypothetical protein